jgi:beta-mannosidase
MKKQPLSTGWRFCEHEPQSGPIEHIRKPSSNDWLPINVPGDVNAALVEHGKIPNPHFDTNGRKCFWVTGKEWWYHLDFEVSRLTSSMDLCLDAVDGPADLWLNDEYLGEIKNAFRLFQFRVAKKLKQGKNEIWIRFRSIDQTLGGPRIDELRGWRSGRALIRKPQFSFGWDWAGPLPSIGLSGPVWVESDNHCRLIDLAIQPFVSGRTDFAFEVTRDTVAAGYEIHLSVKGHGEKINRVVSRATHKSYASIQISKPKMWWPNGYGEQNLYDYKVELRVKGKIVDSRQGKFGLRESKIREEPFTPEAGPGYSFSIEVNGEVIFNKGGNWVPLELWTGMIKPEQYEFYLRKAKEANFNMMRIWGGGIYEPEIFYNLCDELGIMVWQDFMFASTGYPVDLLRDEIIAEATYQLKRLRNHPSIVLWCGINEDVHAWTYHNKEAVSDQADTGVFSLELNPDPTCKVDRERDDPQIYSMILRGLTSLLGLSVPYIESSPQSRDDYGNMMMSGNCHVSCWKFALFNTNGQTENFKKHFEQVCSYDSEFCIQGPCSEKALKTFMAPENHWPPNDAWIQHIQRGHKLIPHHEQTIMIAGGIFGKIEDLPTYVKHGQATHLEMMRAEFESARRDRPNNGGTMMWMYNDCWPTSNWSIIDYYRDPKPAYYAAKRSCEPLLPIIFERAGKIEFFFGNDSLQTPSVQLTFGQETLEGKKIWSKKLKLKGAKNSTTRFFSVEKKKLKLGSGDFLFIEAKIAGRSLPRVTFFPNGWKNISWPTPRVELKLGTSRRVNGKYYTKVQLETDLFARLCHLVWESNGNEIFLSDNYFDISPKSRHELEIESTKKISVNDLRIQGWWSKWGISQADEKNHRTMEGKKVTLPTAQPRVLELAAR